jgi:hypothetical protein
MRASVQQINSLLEQRAAGSMAKATTPEPIGKPGGPGLFHIKGLQLPPYIQHVAHEMMKQGHSESEAIERAIGIVRDWAHGHMPGSTKPVHPDTQAAATLAMTEWEEKKAKAHATPNKRAQAEAILERRA